MSVICQNFVQNAWKKDLCSNCFKSFDDHTSMNGDCDNVTKTTWKSLITDRDRNGNCTKPFRLENGFHGKLLTIVPALNGNDILSNNNKKAEVQHINGHTEKIIGILRIPGSEKKQVQTQTKINVGFKEEEPLVIGYGGNDYDPDEPEWELSNHEDSELILDSLDETEEDRAISKITRENTEFNAKNANLLISNQAVTEEERNAKNRRKGEPPPKASVKPFFRQTTWNEQSAVGNAVSDKLQTRQIINEIPSVTSIETETLCINGERDDTSKSTVAKPEEENHQSVNNDINDVAASKSLVPRTSFLHGGSDELTAPTALYTPGDDFFVSRSNSSSSEETIPSRESPEEFHLDMNQQSNDQDQSVDACEETNQKPQVPVKYIDEASGSDKVSDVIDDSLLYDDGRTIYYAVSPALAENSKHNVEHPRSESIPIINHYAECKIYQDIEPNRTPSPPDGSRRSKLAALAVELEQARYSGGTPIKRQAPSPPDASGYSTPVQNLSRSSLPTPYSTTPVCTTPVVNQDSANKQKASLSSGGSRSKILMCISGSADDTFNKNRKKFSLKKLLKRGSRDVEDFPPIEAGTPNPKAWKQNDFSKVKLEIIHPMDLVNDRKSPDLDNTSAKENNQVSSNAVTTESGYDNVFIPAASDANESITLPSRTSAGSSRASVRPPRPPKPPPPPRAQSMIPDKSPKQQEISKDSPKVENKDDKSENIDNSSKPQVPKRQYKCNGKSEYANLGDIRTSVAPKKPERTTTEVEKKPETVKKCDVYEPFDEIYHDTQVALSPKNAHESCSDSKKDENGTKPSDCPKVTQTSPPVPPPPPYGRITCSSGSDEKCWTNLEASYSLLSAVNLDVLARLLDNALHDRYYQLERPDKESLLWSDFDLEIEQPVQILSDKVIYDATFRHGNRMPVTLLVNPWGLHSSLSGSRNYARYPILAHFMDHVPRNYAFPEVGSSTNSEGILTSVYVLHRARLSPLRSLVEEQEYEKEVFFVMLQLIHSLKILQASGIEDIEPGGHNVFFARTEKDRLNSLVFLSPDLPFEQAGDLFLSTTDSPRITLCSYALSMMLLLLGIKKAEDVKISKPIYRKAVLVITDVLQKEKSYSLSQAKSILDYVLWNAEEAVSTSDRMSLKTDGVLQRWLDVERARKLKNLAAGSLLTNLTAVEEHHLTFLVRSSVRTLREVASML
ncbi:uncharacterized protein [Centruroides vittatus]|uniref:uncharacterized protein n=1 Tax=Centruroides vittatus TaxID=120091 RepID=UPI00350F11A3